MPTTTLTPSNQKYQNIFISRADQGRLRALSSPFNIVDTAGVIICSASKNKANASGDYRLSCRSLFKNPLPASVSAGGHVLGAGDIVEWDVINGAFVLIIVRQSNTAAVAAPAHIVAGAVAAAPVHDPMDLSAPSVNEVTPRDVTGSLTPPSPIPNSVNFCIQFVNLRLHTVHTLQKGSSLVKGRNKSNEVIRKACERVKHKCLCYYWKIADKVYYVGSATPNKNQSCSLLARLNNYLGNHTFNKKNAEPQVNKRVFDGVNKNLQSADVDFGIFEFDFLTIRDRTLAFADCKRNVHVTEMVEYALICHHKLLGEAIWNK